MFNEEAWKRATKLIVKSRFRQPDKSLFGDNDKGIIPNEFTVGYKYRVGDSIYGITGILKLVYQEDNG